MAKRLVEPLCVCLAMMVAPQISALKLRFALLRRLLFTGTTAAEHGPGLSTAVTRVVRGLRRWVVWWNRADSPIDWCSNLKEALLVTKNDPTSIFARRFKAATATVQQQSVCAMLQRKRAPYCCSSWAGPSNEKGQLQGRFWYNGTFKSAALHKTYARKILFFLHNFAATNMLGPSYSDKRPTPLQVEGRPF